VGGLIFLGAVTAPLAFRSILPMFSTSAQGLHVAGAIVRGSLLRLHDIGLICGVVLLFLCVVEGGLRLTRRTIGPQLALLAVMLGLTAYSQFSVIPRMDALLAEAGDTMANPAVTSSPKTDFNRLHDLATRLDEVVLLCGLGLIVLYARPEPVR